MSKILNGELIGKRESVVDQILLLNPHQIPMLNLLGFGNPATQVEHVWFEDEMYADESTVNGAVADSGTSITVASAEPFRAEQIVKVGEELIKVTAVSGTTLTVERGYADTTAAAIEDGAKIEVMFTEGVEGADARAARYKARKRVSNLTQIFDDTISISRTASVVSQYGIDDLYEYEKQKKQVELALQLEKAIINGVKYESGDGAVRKMNGIRNIIKTNVDDAGGEGLTYEKINDVMQDIYEAGGFASGGDFKVIAPAKQKRAISAFQDSEVRLNRGENTRGQVVDFLVSDFGQAEIVLNNNLGAGEIIIVDANRLSVLPLTDSEFTHEYLGKKGDYFEGQIVGEYTLQMVQEKAAGRIKNLG